jgi:imidazolonepropionase-like amidohydrolase
MTPLETIVFRPAHAYINPPVVARLVSLLTFAAIVSFLCVTMQAGAYAQIIAIKAGKLVDPQTGTTSANQVILVNGAKIEAVGAGLAIPAGAAVVDLSRATVFPGLVDAHTHLCMVVERRIDNGSYFFTTIIHSDAYRAIEGVANARDMLAAGFTTVRDVGNAGNYADTALREAIEHGWVPGPTIINAGRIIAPYGGQFHLQPNRTELGEPEYFFADSRDEMRKAIRENIHYGAKVIKIVVDDQRYIYSVDDIRFIVDEAAKAGLKVAAHCWTHAGAHNAAEAGVASIEHGFAMTNEDLELAKKNHVVLVGTEFTELAEKEVGAPGWHNTFVDRLRRAYQIGITMAFGTDVIFEYQNETRGTLAMSYIDSWVEAGVAAKDTLKAMTVNAVQLLGVDAERGTIRPGMAADIVAAPENPLDNIQNLKRVSFVMKDGRVFRDDSHQ